MESSEKETRPSKKIIIELYKETTQGAGCQCVAHAVGAVEPRAQAVVGYVLLVLNVVAVVAAPLILNKQPEHVADGFAPVVERAQRQVHAPAHLRIV